MDKDIKPCPCCNCVTAVLSSNSSIFKGQNYSDRYDEPIASQNYGYQIRCAMCGLQTCWWHLADEAVNAWNNRPNLHRE